MHYETFFGLLAESDAAFAATNLTLFRCAIAHRRQGQLPLSLRAGRVLDADVESIGYLIRKLTSTSIHTGTGLPSGPMAGSKRQFSAASAAFSSNP